MNNAGAGEERAQPVDALPRLLGYAIRAPRADFYCFLLKPQLPSCQTVQPCPAKGIVTLRGGNWVVQTTCGRGGKWLGTRRVPPLPDRREIELSAGKRYWSL